MADIFSKSFWVRAKARPPSRAIRINNIADAKIAPNLPGNTQFDKFPTNEIITSKYTAWNFIFKNLFEQFLRIANFYFLIIAIIAIFNPDNPVSPITSVLPLIFVLFVAALKQGYEDWLRHKEDAKLNNKMFQVVRFANQMDSKGKLRHDVPANELGDAQLVLIKSKNIRVGDIVAVEQNEAFPCDMVLLSSSNTDTGDCYVTTAGLDGETNLKTFSALSETRTFITAQQLASIRGIIECEQPVEDLYSFKGKITLASNVKAVDTKHLAPKTATSNGNGYGAAMASNGHASGNLVTKPLSTVNVLLRGACLKNTEFVFGCAVYTGSETKLSLNSQSSRLKFSRIEHMLNLYLITLFVVMIVFITISFAIAIVFNLSTATKLHWYLSGIVPEMTAGNIVVEWINFLMLYNYVIPISLYVTIEMQKFLGSLFFAWDVQMYDADSRERAKANTSDLNEELGQIEYLFSDKTGTLTENMMEFRQCSVEGVKLHFSDNGLARTVGDKPEDIRTHPELRRFLVAMSLCHTVRVEQATEAPKQPGALNMAFMNDRGITNKAPQISSHNEIVLVNSRSRASSITPHRPAQIEDGDALATRRQSRLNVGLSFSPDGSNYEYQASSPDEKAFLEAARQLGVVFHGTQNGVSVITVTGKHCRYRVLHVLEFDSTRKRMSVVMQDLNGAGSNGWLFGSEYFVLTKGAETAIIERITPTSKNSMQDVIMQHVGDFAVEGLRTLVFSFRPLSSNELNALDGALKSAALRLADRDEALQRAYSDVERELRLLGASGVEDRLQPDVAETIVLLRRAGINVWVLTGDKEETAVNIAYSCGLFDLSATRELRVTRQTDPNECKATAQALLERIRAENSQIQGPARQAQSSNHYYGLIADGASLAYMLNDSSMSEILLKLCLHSSAVLCCRVTPLQKAQVVKLIKDGVPGAVTAAIGDGANDVSMIQEAHVGIGIFGKEGRQAARCSDYCFSRFRSLQRCLLVHGHWYYYRIALLIQYFFFKNIVFMLPQFYYIFFSGYSAASLYDSLALGLYNVTMTTLPIIVVGLFERHLPERLLLAQPELYQRIARNKQMKAKNFAWWVLRGIYYSIVIYFISYMLYGSSANANSGTASVVTTPNKSTVMAYSFGSYDNFGSGTEATMPDGLPMDTLTLGLFICTTIFLAVSGQLALNIRVWTWPVLVGFLATIIPYYCLYMLYEAPFWKFATSTYYVFMQLYYYPVVWLHTAFILILCWLPDLGHRMYQDTFSIEAQKLANFRLSDSSQRDKLVISTTQRSGRLEPASSISTNTKVAQDFYNNYNSSTSF